MSETCKGCGTETNALHYGGDGDVRPPGLCAPCHEERAILGRERMQAARAARLATLRAASSPQAVKGGP